MTLPKRKRPNCINPIDSFERKGAEILMDQIRKYWAKRGYVVHLHIEETVTSNGSIAAKPSCCIRSDLLSGWPRSQQPQKAFVEGV